MESSFLKLTPHAVSKIWGGEKLKSIKNIKLEAGQDPIGETWEVSCLGEGPSYVDGVPLSEYIDNSKLPYLVKLIDTSDNLSVQVHPGDEYAAKYENSKGKTESWLILDADDGAGIFLGLKAGVTPEQFKELLESGGEMNELLNFIPVKKGDFFYVPFGSIHAIGKGVTLAEVQQSSGVTYRVWDWNRVDKNGKGRELHVQKSLDVINFNEGENELGFFRHQNIAAMDKCQLANHEDFAYDSYNGKHSIDITKRDRGFYHSLFVLEGSVKVQLEGKEVTLNQYEAGILVSHKDLVSVESSENALFLHMY